MKIEAIEIVGFKSFSDRTLLEFTDGVTAIVGPNGCGKSNVVDALLWGLGEQSSKRLRGRQMEDIIFAGAEGQKQVGLAEVHVTFGVNGEALPPPYRDCSKVTIGRRYYRSGESEYSINRTPCRLKDINELILQCGMGTRSYAVIEQGRVSRLVSARPEERRVFIEEVAGITRYRARRLEAQRKMEATRQNLLHVDSILAELERQLGTLSRQAKKAERYERYRDEIRELDGLLTARELVLLGSERGGLTRRLQSLEHEQRSRTLEIDGQELELERLKIRMTELDRDLRDRDGEVHAVEVRLNQAEQAQGFAEQESARVGERAGQLSRDREAIEALEQDYSARLEATSSRQGEVVETHERAVQARAELEQGLGEQRIEQGQLEHALEERKTELYEHRARCARAESELGGLERRRQALTVRIERKSGDREALGPELLALEEAERRSGASVAELQRAREEIVQERSGVRERIGDRKQALVKATADLDGARLGLNRDESRLRSLEELLARREGTGEAPRALLAVAEERGFAVRGLVSEVLDAEDRYAVAVEALLGPALDYVVVDRLDDALAPVAFLRESGAGRVGLVPAGTRIVTQEGPAVVGEGVLARARDVVRVPDDLAGLADRLLGDTWIVDGLERAVALRRSGVAAALVTLDGEVLERGGVLRAGSRAGNRAGPLALKNEVHRLEQSVASARVEVSHGDRERHRLASDLEALEARSEDLNGRAEQQEGRRLEAVRALSHAEAAIRRHRDGLESLETELQEARSELDSIAVESSDLERQRVEADGLGAELAASLVDDQAGRDRAASEIEAKAELVLDATRHEAVVAQERRGQERELGELSSRLEDFRSRRAGLLEEEQGLSGRRDELKQALADAARTLAEDGAKREQLDADRETVLRAHDDARGELTDREATVRRARSWLESVRTDIQAEQVHLAELDIRSRSLAEGYHERYGRTLDPSGQAPPISSEEAADWQARLGKLRGQVQSMGEVNPNAVEEHREVLERRDFFSTQRTDLVSSLEDLERAIASINRTSRKRFREAYDQVRAAFREVFPRLFPGGNGDLILTEGVDVLEAGVDIVVHPRGKQLQSIELLSGGEKAMSALALLFAILRVRPSPFCLLDEVDAPLDDANVHRFNELVRELATVSQVVLITHSKQTMGMADRLYGVTMSSPGVSQIVGVKLN